MTEQNVFIFTAADSTAQANFNNTIINGINLKNIIPFVDNEEKRDALESSTLDSEGICYVWGTRSSERNDNTWRRMKNEDLVLGYWNFSIQSASYVVEKIKNKALAIYLWGDRKSPFELVYFMTKPVFCNYQVKRAPKIFGEKYMGFTRINDESTKYLLRTYGSFDNFIRSELARRP